MDSPKPVASEESASLPLPGSSLPSEESVESHISSDGIEEIEEILVESEVITSSDGIEKIMETEMGIQTEEPEVVTEDAPMIHYNGWKAMPYIIGNETVEKLAEMGLFGLPQYLQSKFNMKRDRAITINQIYGGTSNLATVIGAYLSDAHFGRYKTLAFAGVPYFLGVFLLSLTAAAPQLHRPHCSNESNICKTNGGQMAFLLISLFLMIVGAGGVRPCNMIFGADQFNPNTESGQRGMTRYFDRFFMIFSAGLVVFFPLINFIQDKSWTWGFAIPAIMMFLAWVVFMAGSSIYVKLRPLGSSWTSVLQVIVAAIKKRNLQSPEQPWLSLHNKIQLNSMISKLPYTHQFRFLEKAAIISPQDTFTSDGFATNPWRICSLQQVEEVKCLVRVSPVWLACLLYSLVVEQFRSYFVYQAYQSDKHFFGLKIEGRTFNLITMISTTVWMGIYDRIVVPCLRKFTKKDGGITILTKMGVGMIIPAAALVIAGGVESQRRALANSCQNCPLNKFQLKESSLSAFWFAPALVLMGISNGLAITAQNEFYYRAFPENMRSTGACLANLGTAVASYLGPLLITSVKRMTKKGATTSWLAENLNEGKLDYFYYLLAAIDVVSVVYLLGCAKWYKHKTTPSEVGSENSL